LIPAEENAPTLGVVGIGGQESGDGSYIFAANFPRSAFTNRASEPFVLISLSKAEYSLGRRAIPSVPVSLAGQMATVHAAGRCGVATLAAVQGIPWNFSPAQASNGKRGMCIHVRMT
jgi:hypothetical protein